MAENRETGVRKEFQAAKFAHLWERDQTKCRGEPSKGENEIIGTRARAIHVFTSATEPATPPRYLIREWCYDLGECATGRHAAENALSLRALSCWL